MSLQQPLEDVEFRHIGKSYTMLDAPQIVTGKAVYPSDILLPRMLHGKILRSPHPHAKILSIDTSEAEKIKGVKAVITGKDLPDIRYGSAIRERYILARNIVRFVGEPIAAVAALDPDIAEEAVNAIKVKYEKLPAVYDAEKALSPETPTVVHPDFASYSSKSSALVYSARIPKGVPNVTNFFSIRKGDVEKGYSEADLIVENRFETNFGQHCPLEPHASVAQAFPDGSFTIWTGCAIPYRIVLQVSETLQIPMAKVRVVQGMVGGSYGAKNNMEVEPLCAFLSQKTSCPVKIVLTRKEEFLTVVRHPFVVYVKDGVKRDGTIVARTVRCYLNGGAYSGGSGNAVARNCAFGITDTYKIANLSVDTYRAYTNLPPAGAFRGFGTPQVLWAIEQQTDIIAYKLGIDPLEIRQRNLLQDGDFSALGERVHNLPIKECLAKAAEAIKWKEPPRSVGDWRIAKGIAVGAKYSQAPTTSTASVKLYSDGSVNVIVTTVDSGQGIRTAMAAVAAEELQVELEKIQVTFPDTAYTPYDDGNISSRGTFNVGNAVKLACKDLKRQVFRAAAAKLQTGVNDLTTKDGIVSARSSGKTVTFRDLFSTRMSSVPGMVGDEGEFIGRGIWMVKTSKMDPDTSQPVDLEPGQEVRICSFYTPCAQAAEVAVNVRTGELKILKIVTVADAGRAVNRSAVESQLNGAAIMGLGLTISEEMNFENGRLLNSGFLDYRLLTSLDLPEFEAIILESNQVDGPFGAKGVGEIGMVAVGAAVANAVHNAIGIRMMKAPLTTKAILDGLIAKKEQLAQASIA
ncbi:MAG TPA: xanthine dehydrogenase family protein molybdopterin-binding subunit [Nitrososphaerales archaeon]|nr:xanthine dehydrogenase family protein molybdopterin-binding subunit [Nitrososphaerales archaeon]